MIRLSVFQFLPMFAALVWAAVQDMRTRKIRNHLTLALALAGLLQSVMAVGTVSPMQSLAGLGTGFGIGLVMFIIGGRGGGDLKLIAGVGAWMGPVGVIATIAIAAIISMVYVLVTAVQQGHLLRLVHSTTNLVTNVLSVREVGIGCAIESSRTHESIGRPLPYAVPVLIAALIAIVLQIGV